MKGNRKKVSVFVVFLTLVMMFSQFEAASASGAQVTTGQFHTFAAGPGLGYNISGRAQMVRTASGKTLTKVEVWGLLPNTTYPAHVHNQPCSVNNGGSHYQNVTGGPANAVNEIWVGFTTNASGHGNGHAMNDFIARPDAQSVVIHAPDGVRIACADLH